MNKDPYDLTPVPQKDIFTYTDMTEEDFEDIVFNCFLEHAKQSFNYPEPAIDADGIFKFSRDLRAALAAANGPLQATTSKPLPVIPWSGSNLTEMEELLQKVQQLETENADISHAYGVTRDVVKGLCEELANLKVENAALRNELASLKHQTQWECSCGGTDCEGQKENAALRKDKEILDWMNNNIQAIMFKYKPDGFTWDVRGIIRGTMTKEAKP